MNISETELERIAELVVAIERQPAVLARAGTIKPRFVTLQEWAAQQFSKVPHTNTLLKWVHEGRIHPQPQKIGRSWRVRPNAEYRAD